MRKIVLIITLVVLAGCQATSSSDKADRMVDAFKPYNNCVIKESVKLSGRPEDPYHLAIAARSKCSAQREHANSSTYRIYGPSLGSEIAANGERVVLENGVAATIRARQGS